MSKPSTPTPGESLMELSESFDAVIELATGHKAKLVAEGWSEPSAELMGVTLHAQVVAFIFKKAATE